MQNHDNRKLARYFSIVNGGNLPRFMESRRIDIPEDVFTMSLADMWEIHDKAILEFSMDLGRQVKSGLKESSNNLLKLKTYLANEIVKSCHLCERRCGVNRTRSETGYCKVPYDSYYASEFIHIGEEPEIIPSHTIFLAGCTFRCIHCQNSEIIDNPTGDYPVDDDLRKRIENRFMKGARNVNLVGGNPDQHIHNILKLFQDVSVPTPVIWNSNMYHSEESEKLLRGFVDLFLADFKYGPGSCGKEISDADQYWETATRNFQSAKEHADIYIRHLLLPNHIECCTAPVMEWVSKNLPNARFNLMFQFHPSYKSYGHTDLGRILSAPEKQKAIELAGKYGLY